MLNSNNSSLDVIPHHVAREMGKKNFYNFITCRQNITCANAQNLVSKLKNISSKTGYTHIMDKGDVLIDYTFDDGIALIDSSKKITGIFFKLSLETNGKEHGYYKVTENIQTSKLDFNNLCILADTDCILLKQDTVLNQNSTKHANPTNPSRSPFI